jgi:hypothetical protein
MAQQVFNKGNEETPRWIRIPPGTPFYHNNKALHCETEITYKPREWGEINCRRDDHQTFQESKRAWRGLFGTDICYFGGAGRYHTGMERARFMGKLD